MAGTEAAQAEQVWRMVQSLYHAHNEEERKAADNWLKDFQRSPAAWSILDQLLKADGVTEETQFFAANSLRSKINHRDLSQLDSAGRDSLAGSLMAHIHKFRNGPMVVRTQLCLTFSAYAAQFDRTQNNIVQDVCNSLGASPDTVPVDCLLHSSPPRCCSHSHPCVPSPSSSSSRRCCWSCSRCWERRPIVSRRTSSLFPFPFLSPPFAAALSPSLLLSEPPSSPLLPHPCNAPPLALFPELLPLLSFFLSSCTPRTLGSLRSSAPLLTSRLPLLAGSSS